MSQTRANKTQVPTNSDAYNLTGDLATMADTANVVIRVASQAERDGLTKANGLLVARTDVGQAPIERCDGTAWWGPAPHEEWTFGNPANTVPNNTAWGPGMGTLDTGNSIYSGFGSSTTNDILQVNAAGRYYVHWYMIIGGATAVPVYMSIRSASGTIYSSHQWPAAFEYDCSVELNLAAGSQIKFVFTHQYGSTYNSTVTHRIRLSKNG